MLKLRSRLIWIAAGCCVALVGTGWWMWPSPPPFQHANAPDVIGTTAGSVRFIAVGDVGHSNGVQVQVAEAMGQVCADRGCDMVLLLGDNLYPRGMEQADDESINKGVGIFLESVDVPVYGVLGNHDYGHSMQWHKGAWQIDWARRQPTFVMPAQNYSFSADFVDLWAVDTAEVMWGGSDDISTWLKQEMDRSDARWKVVFAHHPYVSNGPHGNAGTYEGWRWIPVASGASVKALFDSSVCGRADLAFGGHDHSLQWIEACGVDWVVSGAGSSHTPLVDRGNAPRFAASHPGFVWVKLTPDRMNVVFFDREATPVFEGDRTR